jgi:hypothetical protein
MWRTSSPLKLKETLRNRISFIETDTNKNKHAPMMPNVHKVLTEEEVSYPNVDKSFRKSIRHS